MSIRLVSHAAVYTRNRNFRLYRSSKLGKSTKLQVAKESRFRSSYSEGASSRRRWSKHFNTLMDSLVCNVRYTHPLFILATLTVKYTGTIIYIILQLQP